MKITYKTNVLDVISLVENNTPALWKKEWNNFPNTWGRSECAYQTSCKRFVSNDQPAIF